MPQFLTVCLSDLRRLRFQKGIALVWGLDGKRFFDLLLALILAVPVGILVIPIILWLWRREGGPVFFSSERIGQHAQPFQLLKFRTMVEAEDAGVATGGDKNDRITPSGRWLRRQRLDELPQLWNILRGDMSFVGPRPPLRRYVERHAALYHRVLQSPPGLTGLATVIYSRAEARRLAGTGSSEETDLVYSRVCVPRKAWLDLIYQRNAGLRLDLIILWRTVARR